MGRYQELYNEKAELVRDIRAINDKAKGAKLTDDEKEKREQMLTRLEGVDDEIKVEERLQEYERSLEAVPDPNQSAQVPKPDGPSEPQQFDTLGEMLQAVYYAGRPEAPYYDPRLKAAATGPKVSPRPGAAPTGHGETISSDGGYLVQKQMGAGLEKKMWDSGQILSRCREIPIGPGSNGYKTKVLDETSRADGSRWGGVQVYWTEEGGQITASTMKFEKFELELVKEAALMYVTDELLADSVALEATANEVVPEEMTFKLENAIINGVGGGQPTGVLQSGAAVTQDSEQGQAAATVVYENILKMWSRIPARSRMNMAWFVDQSAEPQLYSLHQVIGTGGVPVYLPANGISGQPFSTLFGRPVIPHEHGAPVGTVGDIMGLDLSQYLVIRKGGVQSASSMHVRFVHDEMAFRWIYRVNGKSLWRSAVTPKSGGPTQSPYVLLQTRS